MQTHLWYGFQVINVNDSQVYCVGNFSNNRLTTVQIDSSRGSWQTAALSVGILKGAKRPLQRQLGRTYWRRNLTTYWWQINTAQECHMTPICLRATWRLSSRRSIELRAGRIGKQFSMKEMTVQEKPERCSTFPDHVTVTRYWVPEMPVCLPQLPGLARLRKQ